MLKPALNIDNMPNHYRIELCAPGFNREDFLVHTNGYKLSIGALSKKHSHKTTRGHNQLDHFNCECINREIPLPHDVDTDFVTAEYANGILNIYLFKNARPTENREGDIIVY